MCDCGNLYLTATQSLKRNLRRTSSCFISAHHRQLQESHRNVGKVLGTAPLAMRVQSIAVTPISLGGPNIAREAHLIVFIVHLVSPTGLDIRW